jgi:hypothetical protein
MTNHIGKAASPNALRQFGYTQMLLARAKNYSSKLPPALANPTRYATKYELCRPSLLESSTVHFSQVLLYLVLFFIPLRASTPFLFFSFTLPSIASLKKWQKKLFPLHLQRHPVVGRDGCGILLMFQKKKGGFFSKLVVLHF